jgi:hypothetical protein
MMKRIALAFLEGAVCYAGSRAAEMLEDWIDERRAVAESSRASCKRCGRRLACAVHGTLGLVPTSNEDEAS